MRMVDRELVFVCVMCLLCGGVSVVSFIGFVRTYMPECDSSSENHGVAANSRIPMNEDGPINAVGSSSRPIENSMPAGPSTALDVNADVSQQRISKPNHVMADDVELTKNNSSRMRRRSNYAIALLFMLQTALLMRGLFCK